MIVDHSTGPHMCIHRCRANKFEAELLRSLEIVNARSVTAGNSSMEVRHIQGFSVEITPKNI